MTGFARILIFCAVALPIGGCTYVTAVPTTAGSNVEGIRVYGPRALLIVNGSAVSTAVVPDCSKEYAIRFGTVFAKQDLVLDISNGMLTKVDAKQDSTAVPLKLLDIAGDLLKPGPSGEGTSTKVEGGVENQLGIFDVKCSHGELSFTPIDLKRGLISVRTSAPPAPGTVPATLPAAGPTPAPDTSTPIKKNK